HRVGVGVIPQGPVNAIRRVSNRLLVGRLIPQVGQAILRGGHPHHRVFHPFGSRDWRRRITSSMVAPSRSVAATRSASSRSNSVLAFSYRAASSAETNGVYWPITLPFGSRISTGSTRPDNRASIDSSAVR